MSVPDMSDELAMAHAKFKVAAAIDNAVSCFGHRITLAQVERAGGLSRRTFYKHFDSLDDAFERLLNAVGPMCWWLARAAAVDNCATVYEDFLIRFPHAECLIYALGFEFGYGLALTNRATFSHSQSYRRATPSWPPHALKQVTVTNVELLAWARFLDGKEAAR